MAIPPNLNGSDKIWQPEGGAHRFVKGKKVGDTTGSEGSDNKKPAPLLQHSGGMWQDPKGILPDYIPSRKRPRPAEQFAAPTTKPKPPPPSTPPPASALKEKVGPPPIPSRSLKPTGYVQTTANVPTIATKKEWTQELNHQWSKARGEGLGVASAALVALWRSF